MKRYGALIFACFITLQSFCQSQLQEYIQNHTVLIASIKSDHPDNSDLGKIGSAIGEARVVMLGEQGHGDGATFLAKTRLIKYLHEQKGFNVLAFEGDFFGLNVGWDQLKKEREPITSFLTENINGVWSKSQQCSDLLYHYIPNSYQTQKPLIVTGFDTQIYQSYSSINLRRCVDNYLQQKNIPFTSSKAYHEEFLPAVEGLAQGKLIGKEAELTVLEKNTRIVLSQLQEKKTEYGWLLLKNIESFAAVFRLLKDVHRANEIRDKQMAENLEWILREKYPDEKVIVWAANAHISKNAVTAFKDKSHQQNWMGTVFTKDSLNNASTYVIGFSSWSGNQGTSLYKTATKINPPLTNGLEYWIGKKRKYAFIDFKAFRNAHPTFTEFFSMKGHGHGNKVANWSAVFDGIFFIRDMTPSNRIKP